MKSFLLLVLFSLISCQLGGWSKRSLEENNLSIDRSFTAAYKSYFDGENGNYDDYIRLSVYSQMVSGTNYKVCFLDTKAKYPTIQEYVVHVPLPSSNRERNGPEFTVIQHNEYEIGNFVSVNDVTFSKVKENLTKSLENTNEKVKQISYVFTAENENAIFFMVFADTENGEHEYIFSQDKISKELQFINKIK